jgi:tetratricopeptide (TPR) repeat protein
MGKGPEAEGQYRKALAIQEKLAADFPAVPAYQVELGGSYCNFGSSIRDSGKPAESLEWFDNAIRVLKPVHEKEPRDANAKQFLRNSQLGRALVYERQRKFAEAVKDWDRVIELCPPMERPKFRAHRSTVLVLAGQVAEAVAEVIELRKLPGLNAGRLYDFACVYAVASDKIAGKKQEYADAAMEILQKAVKAGWKDAGHMKQDKELDPLREREDFKTMVAELEAKFRPPRETLPPPRKDK